MQVTPLPILLQILPHLSACSKQEACAPRSLVPVCLEPAASHAGPSLFSSFLIQAARNKRPSSQGLRPPAQPPLPALLAPFTERGASLPLTCLWDPRSPSPRLASQESLPEAREVCHGRKNLCSWVRPRDPEQRGVCPHLRLDTQAGDVLQPPPAPGLFAGERDGSWDGACSLRPHLTQRPGPKCWLL